MEETGDIVIASLVLVLVLLVILVLLALVAAPLDMSCLGHVLWQAVPIYG